MDFAQFGGAVYLLKLDEKNVLIDTSTRQNRKELVGYLKELELTPENIDVVLLTHNHFDHVENMDIFVNAEFFGNKKDFKNEDNVKDIRGQPFYELRLIETPGHTFGSVCFYMPEEKILFSGDTLFYNHGIGRTDFPNSSPRDMQSSLDELENLQIKVLCPGHLD